MPDLAHFLTLLRYDRATSDDAKSKSSISGLADNGGPTWTNSLSAGSMAIDAGDTAGCKDDILVLLTADQRGSVRPTDGDGMGGSRCDIGAFE